MDKQLAFILIGFFVICAAIITWAAFGSPKRNLYFKWFTVGYTAFMWLCLIALTIITIIYK